MDSARTSGSYSTRKLSQSISGQKNEGFYKLADSFGNSSYLPMEQDDEKEAKEDNNGQQSIFDAFKNMQTYRPDLSVRSTHMPDRTVESFKELKHRFVQYLWQVLFGDKKHDYINQLENEPAQAINEGKQAVSPFPTISIQFSEEYSYTETQSMSFSSRGSVMCEDGREINFNFDVEMSSTFTEYYKTEAKTAINMIDPLVLNFSGDIASLSDAKFYFDLDCDGVEEEISELAEGNGYLALDINGDGIINDGSELFGTKSGDGFADLAEYDSDHNGWIDENDRIWDSLKIWVADKDGTKQLKNLKESNVGAIFLGNVDTRFNYRSFNSGNISGALRKSGIFLYEDGSGVGGISHLDIAN